MRTRFLERRLARAAAEADVAVEPQHPGQLNAELQEAADERAPGRRHQQRVELDAAGESDERGDDRRVPQHGREVRQEELAMAVQDAERPGGQHEHARHREEDADDGDHELAPLRLRSPA